MSKRVINLKEITLKKEREKQDFENLVKKEKIKKMARFLINLCEGDFAIVFKAKDMAKYFDDDISKDDFFIAITDIEKIKSENPDYFFRNFGFGSKRVWIDLQSEINR